MGQQDHLRPLIKQGIQRGQGGGDPRVVTHRAVRAEWNVDIHANEDALAGEISRRKVANGTCCHGEGRRAG